VERVCCDQCNLERVRPARLQRHLGHRG
jgi:hypothetical protein